MVEKTLHHLEILKNWCVRKTKNKIKYEPKNVYMLFICFLKTKHVRCQMLHKMRPCRVAS